MVRRCYRIQAPVLHTLSCIQASAANRLSHWGRRDSRLYVLSLFQPEKSMESRITSCSPERRRTLEATPSLKVSTGDRIIAEVNSSDTLNRPLRGLRISVTDRCNFRCTYCMPFDEYQWVERTEVLSFAEIERLARLFVY